MGIQLMFLLVIEKSVNLLDVFWELTIIMTDVYLFIPMYIYLSVRNSLPMIDLSQVKES